jgi:hypothetical protein
MTQHYAQMVRILTELAALDELAPLKILEEQRQAGVLSRDQVIELREDMQRLAAMENIDLGRGHSGWFHLTFIDLDGDLQQPCVSL